MADDNNLTSNVLLSDRVVKRLIRTIATNVIAALKNVRIIYACMILVIATLCFPTHCEQLMKKSKLLYS